MPMDAHGRPPIDAHGCRPPRIILLPIWTPTDAHQVSYLVHGKGVTISGTSSLSLSPVKRGRLPRSLQVIMITSKQASAAAFVDLLTLVVVHNNNTLTAGAVDVVTCCCSQNSITCDFRDGTYGPRVRGTIAQLSSVVDSTDEVARFVSCTDGTRVGLQME